MSDAASPPVSEEPAWATASRELGGREGLELLARLVALAPTNLEDPAHGRYEKPNYPVVAEELVRVAREWGFAARIYDPLVRGDPERLHGIPRPNVIVDLDVGAAERILILAHYDVVPVPAEQLPRWQSPPHILTPRADGRWYGRGANDDLGSGVVGSLLAMRQLAREGACPRNVRLLICCDEETGGAGGIEALKAHDEALPHTDPNRILRGEVALIPDGAPEVCAGSSGVLFLDGGFDRPVDLNTVVSYGMSLVHLDALARSWRSTYASPDYPEYQAPEPVVTGRATLTRFDLSGAARGALRPRLTRVHAETDATNQIAQSVTLVFEGPGEKLIELGRWLPSQVNRPFKLTAVRSTALMLPPGALAFSLVGQSFHAGYPHRALNPVPETLRLIDEAVANAKVEEESFVTASFGLDLRLPPEMGLEEGQRRGLGAIHEWIAHHPVGATISAPEDRQRGGYSLAIDHPAIRKLEPIMARHFGAHGVFGEYGGTDASSLLGITTPSGAPLPALVFGSMDRAAHIHEAEESVDPKLLAGVVRTLVEFVRSP